eukprot:m.227956 g.227956  ORF g.227956 m.227956 type:complete len:886 (+) comp25960_c0_seq1:298-2955(+)
MTPRPVGRAAPAAWSLLLLPPLLAAAAGGAVFNATITWVSAGTRAGEAVFLGLSQADATLPPLRARLVLLADPPSGPAPGSATDLPVLQQGNGSVMLQLPPHTTPALGQWGLQLCAAAAPGDCAAAEPAPLFAPDLMWHHCERAGVGVVSCAPGAVLRVFGRRLAYDADGCRLHNATQPVDQGGELQLRLLDERSGTVIIKAAAQTCHSATFALPSAETTPNVLPAGTYQLALANVVGGQRGPFVAPRATGARAIRIAEPTRSPRGTKVFTPAARTGTAVAAALAAAAGYPGGGVVQLDSGVYSMAATATLAVGDRVTLRGRGRSATVLQWAQQTAATGSLRKHLGLVHGANTTTGWTLADLSIVAPQADWLSWYMGSPAISDCAGNGLYSDGHFNPPTTDGLYDEAWPCAGMRVSNVAVTMDKVCAPGTAWPEARTENVSCGGYTLINTTTTKPATASSNGVPPAIHISGRNAVVEDSLVTHYGTCGSNVAFALQVDSAHRVVVRRNTLRYGCSAYGMASTTSLVFEDNVLVPYKNASGGGSNVDTFGKRQEMVQLFYANNTQVLCPDADAGRCPPAHLETMTLDSGAGLYQGAAALSHPTNDSATLTLPVQPDFGNHRVSWKVAAALVLAGSAAGQWRRAEQQADNVTWTLDRPFDAVPSLGLRDVQVGKLEGQLLFVGNRWEGSHFQLYGMCLDCVVAENVFVNSFAASWGRNPHHLVGGWQPNLQTEWLGNTVMGGTGITLMTSDQPLLAPPEPTSGHAPSASAAAPQPGAGGTPRSINASYSGPLNWRVVVRGNRFYGGGGIQLGVSASPSSTGEVAAQTNGNILVDSNWLGPGTCNLTSAPMPSGADINGFLPCSKLNACALRDVVLHGNSLQQVRSCP